MFTPILFIKTSAFFTVKIHKLMLLMFDIAIAYQIIVIYAHVMVVTIVLQVITFILIIVLEIAHIKHTLILQ